jgi:hypothetical protein
LTHAGVRPTIQYPALINFAQFAEEFDLNLTLSPLQIPHDLTHNRTGTVAMENRLS